MLSDQKRTHPEKPTLGSMQASPEAKALVEALHDILRNEEAWDIAETHLQRARKSAEESMEEKYAKILEEARAQLP